MTKQELLRRLGESEPLRSLRLQKERLEDERQRRLESFLAEQEAKRLRDEIRQMGEEPCS